MQDLSFFTKHETLYIRGIQTFWQGPCQDTEISWQTSACIRSVILPPSSPPLTLYWASECPPPSLSSSFHLASSVLLLLQRHLLHYPVSGLSLSLNRWLSSCGTRFSTLVTFLFCFFPCRARWKALAGQEWPIGCSLGTPAARICNQTVNVTLA